MSPKARACARGKKPGPCEWPRTNVKRCCGCYFFFFAVAFFFAGAFFFAFDAVVVFFAVVFFFAAGM